MRKIFCLFFFFLIFIFHSDTVYAQQSSTIECTSTPDSMTCPPNLPDESTAIVNLTIKNIRVKEDDVDSSGASKYYYCLKSNPRDCDKDDIKDARSDRDPGEDTQTINFGKLCGDGDNKLKENDKCVATGRDWFHAGKTYRVTIFEKDDPESPVVRDAAFYISHFYPNIVSPTAQETSKLSYEAVKAGGTKISVELEGRKNRKTGKDANRYNDYWVRIEGFDNDYKTESQCLYVKPDEKKTGAVEFTLKPKILDEHGNTIAELSAGKYHIKIKEGRDANDDFTSCKDTDFTYYHIPFEIGQGNKPGRFLSAIKDPFGKEGGPEGAKMKSQPVCDDADKVDGICTKIPTALGIKINTQPQLFIRDIFTIILSIGGIAAIVFFIQAGYTIMNSAGNKEKVGAAREQITAAVMGLIFIILSIALLEFIGVDILHIPGFVR